MSPPERSDERLVNAVAPIAVTDRSGFDESVHHGAVVALDADGRVALAVGDPDVVVYPRSANKPLQADAMLGLGLALGSEELAVACASHDGTAAHLAVVRSILAGAGLADGDLGNTADLPLDRSTAEALVAAGGERAPIYMNCSGKHAAMLAACAVHGWPISTYLAPDHPLQRAIGERIAELAGPVAHVGVDGCGAPAHACSLISIARAFATLAAARGPVWQAMTAHPSLVAGDGRDASRLMRAVPGLMAKDGAEGVFAAALPDGRAAVVKVADGAGRAAGPALAAALRVLGVDVPPGTTRSPILGHGHAVGSVRVLFDPGT